MCLFLINVYQFSGFRDIYWDLQRDGFKVKIPTCHNLPKLNDNADSPQEFKLLGTEKQIQLTTTETAETRLVTKVRFIIEKQNSLIKNKKALDNIRNSEARHIQIDYRICCAMANFSFLPCVPDGKYTVEIAKRIKKRCLKKQNKLQSLLKVSFTKTKPSMNISNINDFPQITVSQLRKRFTLGSFKIRQSQSYIEQIIEHGLIYYFDEKQIQLYVTSAKVKQELKNTKIVAVLIPSRHKRCKNKNNSDPWDMNPKNYQTYYKTFIQYAPHNADDTSSKNPFFYIKSNYLTID